MSLLTGASASRAEFAILVADAVELIGPRLADNRSFEPCLAMLGNDRSTQWIFSDDVRIARGEEPLLERLTATAANHAPLASAVVYDALTDSSGTVDAGDAIALALTHRDGAQQLALIGYRHGEHDEAPGLVLDVVEFLPPDGPAFGHNR